MLGCPACHTHYDDDVRFCGHCGVAVVPKRPHRTDRFAGETIGDGWQLRARLGAGAFGTVYAATHPAHPGAFAVKVLKAGLQASAEDVARFRREARILSEIRHPNLVAVLACGHDARAGYFLAMPKLDGDNLASRLRRDGPLPFRTFDALVQQACAALGHIHAAGVIHRDVKAENLFLDRDDHVRLLDFGLAKLVSPDPNDAALRTSPSQIVGCPATMSPEQVLAQQIDGRADLYGLGVVLFEALTGTLPFEASNSVLLLRKHVFDPPPRPSERAPWAPPQLDAWLLGLLEKDPAQRPTTAAEVAARWQTLAPELAPQWRLRPSPALA